MGEGAYNFGDMTSLCIFYAQGKNARSMTSPIQLQTQHEIATKTYNLINNRFYLESISFIKSAHNEDMFIF